MRNSLLVAAVVSTSFVAQAYAAPADGTLWVLEVHGIGTATTAAPISLLGYDAAVIANGVTSGFTPTTYNVDSAGANELTLGAKSGQHDGMLRLSGNGQYLTFGGYRAATGAADPAANAASSVNRAIGKFTLASGQIDTTQAVTDAFNYAPLTAVVTQDGSRYWLAGGVGFNGTPAPASNPINFDLSGGVRYVDSATASTSYNFGYNQTTSGAFQPDSVRSALIAQGQLYVTTASQGSYSVPSPIDGKSYRRGAYQVGLTTPTATLTPAASPPYFAPGFTPEMNSLESSSDKGQELAIDSKGSFVPKSDVVFADLNPLIPGYDTAYGTGGKADYQKWSLYKDNANNYVWKQVFVWDLSLANGGGFGDINAMALSIESDGTTVDLFAATDSRIYHFTDAGGYTDVAALDNFKPTTTFSFVSADAGTQFRGIAFVAAPEPASLGILALGGMMIFRRSRADRRSR